MTDQPPPGLEETARAFEALDATLREVRKSIDSHPPEGPVPLELRLAIGRIKGRAWSVWANANAIARAMDGEQGRDGT